MEDFRIHRYDVVKQAMMTENPIEPVLDKARAALRAGHSVWLVGLAQAPREANRHRFIRLTTETRT